MESTLLFEKMMLGLTSAPSSTPTENLIFEDNFANGKWTMTTKSMNMTLIVKFNILEIYMKYIDESESIDLFAEMEQDEKVYLDGELNNFSSLNVCNNFDVKASS